MISVMELCYPYKETSHLVVFMLKENIIIIFYFQGLIYLFAFVVPKVYMWLHNYWVISLVCALTNFLW